MPKDSTTFVRQVPLLQAEHGLAHPIAMLKLWPHEITRRRGVQFETARDDLDEFEGAVVCAATGRQFGLEMHKNQPVRGTVILTNERSRDWGGDLREALQLLHFDWEDLSWIHPEIRVKELA